MSAAPAVVLVGCGNMGRALLTGWLDRAGVVGCVTVIEPDSSQSSDLIERFDIRAYATIADARDVRDADVIVFAVKPQTVSDVAGQFARLAMTSPLFISIAAGVTIGALQRDLGAEAPIVRVMPNTPATVGAGVSVACANQVATDAQHAIAQALLGAVGTVHWIEDEALMDAVTAVSGSGPAYVFLLTECLAEAGMKAGLSAELAAQLARETVIGASLLLRASPTPAENLRRQVTSPGGTTAAAIEVLDAAGGLRSILADAVKQAARRSRELGGQAQPARND
ncbi:MAG: pyrroline-5-carboxylate reductase [Hyphomicrobiales bacterium]|nr:pyrroline-5-carboxylate reductase [Hyphomicrobiales bacterium]